MRANRNKLELAMAKGFLIVAGKVPIAYFKTKCFGVEFEEGEARQQDTAGTGAAV